MFTFFWKWIKYFTPKEKWGNSNKVSCLLIFVLDLIRYATDKAINIHCAFDEKGHATNSRHYLGLAADFHFIGCSSLVPLKIMLGVLDSIGVPYGLGYYSDWNNKGYHLDIFREKTLYWLHDKDGYHYYTTQDEFLKALGA